MNSDTCQLDRGNIILDFSHILSPAPAKIVMTPNEARALAALLVKRADRAATLNAIELGILPAE